MTGPAEGTPDSSTSEPGAPYADAPAQPSDTRSTGDLKLSKAGLRSAIAAGFKSGCRLLAVFVASQQERDYDVWVPDAEDVEGVSRPAANIVYRRLPDEAKGGDLIDVVSLGLALVGYGAKNMQRRAQLRTVLQLQETAQGTGPAGEDGPTP
jgi:hypothetical protein